MLVFFEVLLRRNKSLSFWGQGCKNKGCNESFAWLNHFPFEKLYSCQKSWFFHFASSYFRAEVMDRDLNVTAFAPSTTSTTSGGGRGRGRGSWHSQTRSTVPFFPVFIFCFWHFLFAICSDSTFFTRNILSKLGEGSEGNLSKETVESCSYGDKCYRKDLGFFCGYLSFKLKSSQAEIVGFSTQVALSGKVWLAIGRNKSTFTRRLRVWKRKNQKKKK